MSTPYTSDFYNTYRDESQRSAGIVASLLLSLTQARSVVDVGCGIGTWLQAFRRLGIGNAVGIDGNYVDRQQLLIPPDTFRPHDLNTPIRLETEFDLALSVEVAEHLSASRAGQFVESLCALAPVVAFSAAIPYQGGNDHVNEQWPGYWAALFAKCGYAAYDCLRPQLWNIPEVAYYYAQNMLLFVRKDRVASYPALGGLSETQEPLAMVHPRRWLEANDPKRQRLPPLLHALPHSLSNAVKRRVRRLL